MNLCLHLEWGGWQADVRVVFTQVTWALSAPGEPPLEWWWQKVAGDISHFGGLFRADMHWLYMILVVNPKRRGNLIWLCQQYCGKSQRGKKERTRVQKGYYVWKVLSLSQEILREESTRPYQMDESKQDTWVALNHQNNVPNTLRLLPNLGPGNTMETLCCFFPNWIWRLADFIWHTPVRYQQSFLMTLWICSSKKRLQRCILFFSWVFFQRQSY
jgi:hypothetical protein